MKWYFMGGPDKLGLAGTYEVLKSMHTLQGVMVVSGVELSSSDRRGQPGLSLMVGLSSANRTISIG